jgi:hypothetical protein
MRCSMGCWHRNGVLGPAGRRGATVQIGTNKVYGAIHQFGGTIRPKNLRGLLFFGTPGSQVWGAAR